VAQTAAVLALEPEVERIFHPDSYGYRPGRSPNVLAFSLGSGVGGSGSGGVG
jgi:hypothetical protein